MNSKRLLLCFAFLVASSFVFSQSPFTIINVSFSNRTYDGGIITQKGAPLFTNVMYLQPEITYNSNVQDEVYVNLLIKFIDPNGRVLAGKNSPSGYSYSSLFLVAGSHAKNAVFSPMSWGNSNGTLYSLPGTYKFEVWCNGSLCVSTAFLISEKSSEGKVSAVSNNDMNHYDNGRYKGPYDENGKRHGKKGTYYWENGDKYVGEWVHGERTGKGTYYFRGGSTYYGQFLNGLFSGRGVYTPERGYEVIIVQVVLNIAANGKTASNQGMADVMIVKGIYYIQDILKMMFQQVNILVHQQSKKTYINS